jgi:outer membrane receptor protein involved in Fe transport
MGGKSQGNDFVHDINDDMLICAWHPAIATVESMSNPGICTLTSWQRSGTGGRRCALSIQTRYGIIEARKRHTAGGALSYSASYFLIKWDDMQTSRSFDCGFGFRENVGKATSNGLELELHAAVTENLVLGFGGAYINSELDEDVPNLNAEEGDQVPYVPEFSFNTSADYSFPLTDSLQGILWGNVQYIGERLTEFNHDPTTNYRKMDAYTVANARIGVQWDSNEVSFYINNMFDDGGVVRALRRPPFDPDAVIRTQPRTIGLILRKYF